MVIVCEGSAPATGYSLVLPPGWVRIPLRDGTGQALEDKVFRGIEVIPHGVPREQATAFRTKVRRRVGLLAGKARTAGGLDLYVPARARPGALMAASFLVSGIRRREGAAVRPESLLGQLAGDRRGGEGGELRGVGESVAVRWEYVQPPGDDEADTSARHVDYVLPVPGDGGRWLAVTFSAAGDGDPASPLTRALAELFDALMTTFRWTFAD